MGSKVQLARLAIHIDAHMRPVQHFAVENLDGQRVLNHPLQRTFQRPRSVPRVRTRSALDLEEGMFTLHQPAAIARSLRRSALASRRRKSDPYRSAMSMLVFYINRAGARLPAAQPAQARSAKDELRKVFGRPVRG